MPRQTIAPTTARSIIEASQREQYAAAVARNSAMRARALVRRAFDVTNDGYAAMALLQYTGDAEGDAARAIDEYRELNRERR